MIRSIVETTILTIVVIFISTRYADYFGIKPFGKWIMLGYNTIWVIYGVILGGL